MTCIEPFAVTNVRLVKAENSARVSILPFCQCHNMWTYKHFHIAMGTSVACLFSVPCTCLKLLQIRLILVSTNKPFERLPWNICSLHYLWSHSNPAFRRVDRGGHGWISSSQTEEKLCMRIFTFNLGYVWITDRRSAQPPAIELCPAAADNSWVNLRCHASVRYLILLWHIYCFHDFAINCCLGRHFSPTIRQGCRIWL